MQRKHIVYLLAMLVLLASLLPMAALAQGPNPDDETALEQAKALAAEQNPEAAQVVTPLAQGPNVQYPLFMGVDDTTVPAYQMDVTNSATIQAFIGAEVWGSAYDPVNDIVYFNSGSTLYEWPVGGTINQLGTIVNSTGATQSMVGLAFYDGQLYGTKNIANEAIWAIDTTTLVATVFIDYVDGDLDCGGLSADPNTGTFYCTNDDATPHGAGLVIVNPDASVTFVAPYPAGQTDIDGLAVSDDGFAYLVIDEPGFIYVWDFTAGAYAPPLTNPWTSAEVFSGGAWIFEPGQGGVCPAGPEVGELTASDPVFNRPVGAGVSCSPSGVGTAVHYDVYSYNLAGPPPHDLFASLVGGASFDSVMVFYQAGDGSQNPFDPTQPCLNSVEYNDDFGGTLQSQISGTGLGAGWIDVVVTTFSNGVTGPYTMDVSSQSCQGGGGGTPNIDVAPLSLSSTQPVNTSTSQALGIGNTGDADLTWTIDEEPAPDSAPVAASGGVEKLGAPSPVQMNAATLAKLIEANLADVVQDGSFEAGTPNPFWTEASTNFGTPLCDTASCGTGGGTSFPLTGDWWAWFGGIAAFEAGSVSQSVTIPSGGPATLSFWVMNGACSGSASDYLEVNMDGTQLWVTTAADPACGTLGYRQVTLDVSAYADGGAHTLQFSSEVFGGGNTTNFAVDDVVLDAQGGGGAVCSAPSDVPWLSVSPNNGTTAPAGTTPVDVTFDSTGLAAGTYNANLCITSNDPDPAPGNGTGLVVVPVDLTVLAEPAIAITKTVGLVDGVCATESSIEVLPGTDVYYCYTVTNTGDITLDLHDLDDDQLGTIFSGLNYALTPGSSVNTVAAGLTISATIDASTTNVATWTAYNPTGPSATATATATVTVADIAIAKTVGTDAGVCAASNNITVPAGTTVYYCYSITNTGDVTLNLHDLDDDQLGTILSGFNFALAPGASVNTVAAGLSLPAVMNVPTTNTATWTAYNTGGISVTATATATVDVLYMYCNMPDEGFDSGVPPMGWSVVNNIPGGPTWGNIASCGPSGSGGNWTGGSGDAACMSPGALLPAPYDAELRSPMFSLAGQSAASVSYLANYQAWAGIDRLNLDISADGGATWTTLRSWNTDQGAFQNTPGVSSWVNLAAWLGQSDLMLRWHYFWNDPDNALGWYAQIDNVGLDCTPIPPTAVTLEGLTAQAPLPVSGLPLAALPAVVSLALGAAYALRRKQ